MLTSIVRPDSVSRLARHALAAVTASSGRGSVAPARCSPAVTLTAAPISTAAPRWAKIKGLDGNEGSAGKALKPGSPAPVFIGQAVVNGQFKEVNLEDYKGKYVVLFFYPLDFTFVCPTEIIAFSERAEEFRSIGCELIACSTDSHFSHLAWTNTPRENGGLGQMNIPLLGDTNLSVARAYGVLHEDAGIAFRGLFIIDGNGTIRQITVNDLPVGRDVDETLRLVQAFQFTDKHGEVCPAGWKPGKKSMKPSADGVSSYLKDNPKSQ